MILVVVVSSIKGCNNGCCCSRVVVSTYGYIVSSDVMANREPYCWIPPY